MLSAKRNRWKIRAVVVGVLALVLLMAAVVLVSTDVQAQGSTLAVQSVPTVQPTPTVDATVAVTALNTEKLVHENDWWWNYGAMILTSVISSLTLAAAGVFAVIRYFNDRGDAREKQEAEEKRLAEDRKAERERRDEEQKRWLKSQEAELDKRAEERFQSAVIGLGDEKEGAQIGAAILLRTFLRSGYEQFYVQVFDLAVANLRRRGVSKIVQHQLWSDSQNPDITLPLTTLDQALIVVFKEAFPLARDQEKREPPSLDATDIQLDNAYLEGADLKHLWGPQASLRKANLGGANLNDANLSGADLSEADLSFADFSDANFNGAILNGANLSCANLNGAYFYKANLSCANLNGAGLGFTDLRRVNLSFADLSGADLSGANLSGAILREANLNGAIFNGADLSEAHLFDANLAGANLNGAKLGGAEGVTKERRVAYKAQGALVDEEPASNVSQGSVSTSSPLNPGKVQSPSSQETSSIPDASQSNGMSSQTAPDQGPSGEIEKGDRSGRTP